MTAQLPRSARRLLIVLLLLLWAPGAAAEGPEPTGWRRLTSCDRNFASRSELLKSPASMDLYHGLAYFAGSGIVRFATRPSRRWSAVNKFDDELRDQFARNGTGERERADDASDGLLAVSIGVLPAASLISKHYRERDCTETYDMATDIVESAGLTVFLTEVIKVASGRKRPISRRCGSTEPEDADCGDSDNERSFISGHASLAAAGAGLTCAFSIKREAWGPSRAAKASPCVLGVATALGTGLLRMAADRHWATDVLAGFTLGGLIGYFDTWGPLDLLKFETRDSGGEISARGMVMPASIEGKLGARVMMVF